MSADRVGPVLEAGAARAISYGIVRDHGGSVEVEPAPGEGSRFTVVLPRRPPGR